MEYSTLVLLDFLYYALGFILLFIVFQLYYWNYPDNPYFKAVYKDGETALHDVKPYIKLWAAYTLLYITLYLNLIFFV